MRRNRSLILVNPIQWGQAPIQIRRVRGVYAPAPSDLSSLRPAQAQARSWLDSSVSGPAPIQVCSVWGCRSILLGHATTARRIQSTWARLRSRSAAYGACTLPLRSTQTRCVRLRRRPGLGLIAQSRVPLRSRSAAYGAAAPSCSDTPRRPVGSSPLGSGSDPDPPRTGLVRSRSVRFELAASGSGAGPVLA